MATTTHASTGSKPMFTGLPAFIADTYDWQDNFEDTLSRAVESAVEYASKGLRYAASKDAAWKRYAGHLSCAYRDGEIHYVFSGTPEEIQAMVDLEYGTPTQAPNPLLRPLVERNNRILGEKIDIILAEEVPIA